MKVVAGTVKIGRHHRHEARPVLAIVGLAHLQPGNLGQGVRLVGRLEDAGEQVLLLHRLRRMLRVDARRTEEEQPLDAAQVGLVDDIVLDRQVDMDELGRIGVVGMDPANLRRGQDHVFGLFTLEK